MFVYIAINSFKIEMSGSINGPFQLPRMLQALNRSSL